MARQPLSIETFNRGQVSNVDPRDIPNDAAAESTNIDPRAYGKLSAMTGRVALSDYGSSPKSSGVVTRDDGVFDVLLYNNGIRVYKDVYGSPLSENPEGEMITGLIPHNDYAPFVSNNREAHVGLGAKNKPLWVGYVSHQPVNGTKGGVVVEDAELTPFGALPLFHKIIVHKSGTDTFIIGIEFGGNRVIRINATTNIITHETHIENTLAMGDTESADTDAAFFYLYSQTVAHPLGVIRKIRKDDLTVEASATIGTLNLPYSPRGGVDPEQAIVTDLGVTSSRIWIAARFDQYNHLSKEATLFSVNKMDIPGSNIVATNRTPQLTSTDTNAGAWVWKNVDGSTLYPAEPSRFTQEVNGYRLSLTRLPNNRMGWVVRARPYEEDRLYPLGGSLSANVNGPYYRRRDTDDPIIIHSEAYMFVMGDTHSAGSKCPMILPNKFRVSTYFPPPMDMHQIVIVTMPGDTIAATQYASNRLLTADTSGNISASDTPVPTALGEALYDNELALADELNADGVYAPTDDNDGDMYFVSREAATVKKSPIISLSTLTTVVSDTSLTVEVTNEVDGEDLFEESKYYFYRVSANYDGYQQSPLSPLLHVPEQGMKARRVKVVVEKSAVRDRVTHLSIWRAEGSTPTAPNTFYRLVKTIPFDDPQFNSLGDSLYIEIVDRNYVGPSYEAETGMPETLQPTMVGYGLAVALNQYLFVGKCGHPQIDDASHYIFRSKPFRYSMFDWSTDLIRLPLVPNVMAEFGGRLYVFGDNQIFRIEPNNFYVEDLFEGFGCDRPDFVCTTRYGIFFVHGEKVYHFDGREFTIISEEIEDVFKRPETTVQQVVYSSESDSLMVLVGDSALEGKYFLTYSIDHKRWDRYFPFLMNPAGDVKRLIPFPKGEMYYTTSYETGKVLAGGKIYWEWTSKLFDFGEAKQRKKVYKIEIAKDAGTLTEEYRVDGGAWKVLPVDGFLPEADRALRDIQIRLSSPAGGNSATVYSLAILYRRMIGYR